MRVLPLFNVAVLLLAMTEPVYEAPWPKDLFETLLEPDTAAATPVLNGNNVTVIAKTRAGGTSIQRVPEKLGVMMPDECSEPYVDMDKFAAFGAIVDRDGKEKVVMDFDGDERRYPASLSKMMTLLLALEDVANGKIALDARIPVTDDIRKIPSTHFFQPKKYQDNTISLHDALMVIGNNSANDAAMAVSAALVGKPLDYSWAAFANRMTRRAWALGMNHTRFPDAAGFIASANHRSTARDMYILKRYLDETFPQSRQYLYSPSFSVADGDKTISAGNGLPLIVDRLVPKEWQGVAGKLGYVTPGGRSLAMTFENKADPSIKAHYVVMGGTENVPYACLGALVRMTLMP